MEKFNFKKSLFIFLVLCTSFIAQSQTNQYLHFDGVDDYTELPNGAAFVDGLNTISMTGWFNTDALVYGQGMMSIRGGGTGAGEMYLIQLSDGIIECRVITSTGLHQVVAPAGTIVAGTWQHIAWVFNETTVTLFVDGVSIGSSDASGTFQSTTRPFTVGKCLQPGFNFIYGGAADEVSLWSKALSQAEIATMITNELQGNEANLEIYYKFNQGTPAGNNTNIMQLLDNSGVADKNSNLMNFALTGETSNFNGTLESGFQAINFTPVPNKLISDVPFALEATVTSGLTIAFEVISGPATVAGNTLTLDGVPGEVTVKASQAGNADWDPAEDIFATFQVLDPAQVLVESKVLHPLNGDVFAPSLIPLQIAVETSIEFPELFMVAEIIATINGEVVTLVNHENGFFSGWWTPTSYGNFDLEIEGTNNYGESTTAIQNFDMVQQATNITVMATDQVWVKGDIPTVTVESDLPSSIGAFDQILGTLVIDCPTGGCDPWDRISSVEAQGKDGEWFEIIRYLTPYGVACQSEIDLTDFSSLLTGKTKFRVSLGTQGNGFEYTLLLNYQAGVPENAYSTVSKLWYQTYQFGDMANLQPTAHITANFSANTENAKIKLVSSGHGWGANNTGNAAEFQNNTHDILVNNTETFEQNNWVDCDPNPDGCSPQNGTWRFNRAGWCPGSIAQFFDFDMTPFVQQSDINLRYRFDEGYSDLCHPNNPDCVTGQTCDNCNDGFNPHLIVSSYLISFGNAPTDIVLGNDDIISNTQFTMYPNPSGGIFYIDYTNAMEITDVVVYDYLGRQIYTQKINGTSATIKVNMMGSTRGVYLVSLKNNTEVVSTKKLIME
ncbi:LamG-like jellyroll fold domain-containing protein [Patiriisocius sp. Uisw_017]|jgi:hypothetical protein|uniref:LamG-like jellyroll fold domain-containing protein n=1 Tax=Patiriisocius sp. Uisw_017 TaxID=3230968 RepID=UPI0039E79322